MEELSAKLEQLGFASQRISELEKKIENSPYGLRDDDKNKEKWIYYTGFPFEVVNCLIFDNIKDYISCTSTTVLSSFNQLLLTLIKLRLNYDFKDLAYHFKIHPTTASTYFENVINVLYRRFEPLITWPDTSVIKKNIPHCFFEVFQEKTTVIVDCFEVFIQKPPSLLTQQQCWSNYKHHNTVKFLIGINPAGCICYISEAWGGRASDKQLVEFTDFCNKIKPGDVILADRGFLVKETIGILGGKLVIPAFTKGKNQLHPLDIEATRHVAHVRIHVERVIGMIKNKFNIFKDTIPVSMLKKGSNKEDKNLLDKIIRVCCALINLSLPIIPL